MKKLTRSVPVFSGSLPYIFVCFADRDAERVEPALRRLSERGCRLWYYTGKPKNSAAFRLISERIEEAALAVLFLTDNARNDTTVKSDIRHFLNTGKKAVVLELDKGESYLKLGLPEDLPVVESDEELLRADGFTADLIGEPPKKEKKLLKILAALFLAAALAVAALAGVRIARGEPVTADPAEVTELRLNRLPEPDELAKKYPKLEKIMVPQSLAGEALERFGGYTIVLQEG